jgi:hypothetical protein
MSATIHGVVERTFRCTSAPPAHAPAATQAQVRVVLKQSFSSAVRVHAVVDCGMGAAGEQAAVLMRKRLVAGKACIARGRAIEPLAGSMDVFLRGCAEIFTEEPACQAVKEPA